MEVLAALGIINFIFVIVLGSVLLQYRGTVKQLQRAKEEAEIANRTKDEIMANMSHELRTPLNAIIGFSDIMKCELFGPVGCDRYREYTQNIHESGVHLLAMINDILDVAKLESGTVSLHQEIFDINNILTTCMMMVHDRAAEHDIVVSSYVDVKGLVFADERKVKQIIINLLSNAIKFSKAGGNVCIRTHTKDDELYIEVADTGIGIAEEDLEKILRPFEQGCNPFTSKVEGTGLGLSIVHKLVLLHRGRIAIESKVGVGTNVIVILPKSCLIKA